MWHATPLRAMTTPSSRSLVSFKTHFKAQNCVLNRGQAWLSLWGSGCQGKPNCTYMKLRHTTKIQHAWLRHLSPTYRLMYLQFLVVDHFWKLPSDMFDWNKRLELLITFNNYEVSCDSTGATIYTMETLTLPTMNIVIITFPVDPGLKYAEVESWQDYSSLIVLYSL